MRGFKVGVYFLNVMLLMGLWAASLAMAQEKPRSGGILQVALAADPPAWTRTRSKPSRWPNRWAPSTTT